MDRRLPTDHATSPYASVAVGVGRFATAGSTMISPSIALTVEVRAFLPPRADRQLDLLVDERASGTARRTPGCSPSSRSAPAPRRRSAIVLPAFASVERRPAAGSASAISRTSSCVSGANSTTSSMRLRNSGGKRRSSSRITSPCTCSTPTVALQEAERARELPEVLRADVRRHDDDRRRSGRRACRGRR